MKPNNKWLALLITSLVVLGLLLLSSGTALAAINQGDKEPEFSGFSLQGALASKAPVTDQPMLETWTVNGQVFIVATASAESSAAGAAAMTLATVCSDPAGEVIACADVSVNDLISVSGDIVHGSGAMPEIRFARTIQVLVEPTEGEQTYTYTGVLTAIHEDSAVIGALTFVGDDASIHPDFFGLGDTVSVTFKILENGDLFAISAEVLEQANPYSFSGTLEGIVDNGDGTATWTINGTDFIVNSETSLPAEAASGDEVKVTFLVQSGANLALSIELVSAHAPQPPTKEELCTGGLEDHPELLQKAQEMGISDPAALLEFYCSGVSQDDILKAIQLAAGSNYAPEELLAMLTSGMSWEEIEALLAGHTDTGSQDNSSAGSGHDGLAVQRYLKTLNISLSGRFLDPGDSDDSGHSDEPSPDNHTGDNSSDSGCTDGGG